MIDEPDKADHADCNDDRIEAVKVRLDGVPVRSEPCTRVGQRPAPGQRSKKGVDVEAEEVHARDSGGQRDEGADNGQQPRKEDRRVAVAREPTVRKLKIVLGDQKVAAILLNQGAAAVGAYGVCGNRTGVAAQRAGERHPLQVEPAKINQVTGKRHDDFRRNGNAGRFNRHQEEDARVTGMRDGGGDKTAG